VAVVDLASNELVSAAKAESKAPPLSSKRPDTKEKGLQENLMIYFS
jgi:hypothetical protein